MVGDATSYGNENGSEYDQAGYAQPASARGSTATRRAAESVTRCARAHSGRGHEKGRCSNEKGRPCARRSSPGGEKPWHCGCGTPECLEPARVPGRASRGRRGLCAAWLAGAAPAHSDQRHVLVRYDLQQPWEAPAYQKRPQGCDDGPNGDRRLVEQCAGRECGHRHGPSKQSARARHRPTARRR